MQETHSVLESIYRSLAVGEEALSLGVDVLHPWLISGSKLEFRVANSIGLVEIACHLTWEKLVMSPWSVR